jgi:hypothetical protein
MVTIITYPYQHRGPLHIKSNLALHISIKPGELVDSFYALWLFHSRGGEKKEREREKGA